MANQFGGYQVPPQPNGPPGGGPGIPIDENLARDLIAALGASVVHTSTQVGNLAQAQAQSNLFAAQANQTHAAAMQQIAGAWRGGGGGEESGYRTLKPKHELTKIKAANAKDLMEEMAQFEVDLGELGIQAHSEAAYRQFRAVVVDRAKEVVNLVVVQGQGSNLKADLERLTANGAPRDQRDDCGGRLYNTCVQALERSVRLTREKRIEIIALIDAACVMQGDSVQAAEDFLGKWRKLRYLQHRERLVGLTANAQYQELLAYGMTPQMAERYSVTLLNNEQFELNRLLKERISIPIYEFIMLKPPNLRPISMDAVVNCVEEWIVFKDRSKERSRVDDPRGAIRAVTIQDPPSDTTGLSTSTGHGDQSDESTAYTDYSGGQPPGDDSGQYATPSFDEWLSAPSSGRASERLIKATWALMAVRQEKEPVARAVNLLGSRSAGRHQKPIDSERVPRPDGHLQVRHSVSRVRDIIQTFGLVQTVWQGRTRRSRLAPTTSANGRLATTFVAVLIISNGTIGSNG